MNVQIIKCEGVDDKGNDFNITAKCDSYSDIVFAFAEIQINDKDDETNDNIEMSANTYFFRELEIDGLTECHQIIDDDPIYSELVEISSQVMSSSLKQLIDSIAEKDWLEKGIDE